MMTFQPFLFAVRLIHCMTLSMGKLEPIAAVPAATLITERIDAIIEQMTSTITFDELYNAYAPRIYLLSLRLTGDPTQAEELTQETFIRAWKSLPQFRQESSPATWLSKIAANASADLSRRQARRRQTVLFAGELRASESNQYDAAITRAAPDTYLDLEQAVRALPAGAREMLVLHVIEGFGYAEIAEMLEVSVGTAKSQVHRARTLLMEKLNR
jgi:RNA polymerase sigma-70 factor, ECF subfamily